LADYRDLVQVRGVSDRASGPLSDLGAPQLYYFNLNGFTSILGSHLNFGDPRRGWDFVSPGHGDLDLEGMIRVLNRIGYDGPLSVEWEDSGMDREHGASEAVEIIKATDFKPSAVAFDAAFEKK